MVKIISQTFIYLSGPRLKEVIMKDLVIIAWSGGNDSAFALDAIKQNVPLEVAVLQTTVTEGCDRIFCPKDSRNAVY
jgi:PP-loop superfamily ATP-utilizing enzyme